MRIRFLTIFFLIGCIVCIVDICHSSMIEFSLLKASFRHNMISYAAKYKTYSDKMGVRALCNLPLRLNFVSREEKITKDKFYDYKGNKIARRGNMSFLKEVERYLKSSKEKKNSQHSGVVGLIHDECLIISSIIEGNSLDIQNEIGNLLFLSFSLCTLHNYDLETTIQLNLYKFNSRCDLMIALAKADGYVNFDDQPMAVMNTYWNKAKLQLRQDVLTSLDTSLSESLDEKSKDVLARVVDSEMRARHFGFRWTDYQQLIDKVHAECDEITEVAYDVDKRKELQDELGDLMLVAFSFCMHFNFDLNETLEKVMKNRQLRSF